ncbi:unnamed protein product [Durusdinium trenchii]|uniref:Ubiquitin-like domain-containing protein n=1 Tax=Durusdinium trenchii TaxID=1381693 RepID=A0ABP0LMT8_9DINO
MVQQDPDGTGNLEVDAEEAKTISLRVQLLSGKEIEIEVPEDGRVGDIKTAIFKATSIPYRAWTCICCPHHPACLKRSWWNPELSVYSWILASCTIKSPSLLEVLVRIPVSI